jgi:hypothetical protein
MLIRAIGLVKEAYDWFSFSQQAFSWLGLAQRAAAVTATAAVVAAPVVVATKPWQPTAPAPVAATTAPGGVLSAAEVDRQIDKISKDNLYSRVYLVQPERRELLKKIVETCKNSTDIVVQQCDIAVPAWNAVLRYEKEKLAREEFLRNKEKDAKVKFSMPSL